MKNYNILDQKWMPVNTIENEIVYVSPLELFNALELYSNFAGSPDENYSMLRFVCALGQSSKKSQPTTLGQLKLLKSKYAQNAIEYMTDNYDLFWMRGEKPFLQCTEVELGIDGKKSEIASSPLQLREQYSEGNNPCIYDMSIASYDSLGSIVLDLLVRSTYSVSYGKSGAVPTRSCMWNKSTLGIMNVYVSGDSLHDTIWMNMHYGIDFGISVWESRFDESYSTTYLNRLIYLSAKIWISDTLDEMKCSTGIQYPDIDSNAFMIMHTVKNERIPVRYTRRNRIWREYSRIFGNRNDKPESLKGGRYNQSTITITTLASKFKLSMGVYNTEEFFESTQILRDGSQIENVEYAKFYEHCVELSDTVSDAIINSFCGVRVGVLYPNSKPSKTERSIVYAERDVISEHFWNYLDNNSPFLFQCDGNAHDFDKWKSIVNSGLLSLECFIQTKYGFVTSYKFGNCKAINDIKFNTLISKEK